MNRWFAALVLGLALSAVLAAPESAVAQSTGTDVKYPDDNVAGGAVTARRPGTWISKSFGVFAERQDIMLRGHGGATPQEREDPEIRTQVLVNLIDTFFATLQDILANALISAGTTATTDTTTGS